MQRRGKHCPFISELALLNANHSFCKVSRFAVVQSVRAPPSFDGYICLGEKVFSLVACYFSTRELLPAQPVLMKPSRDSQCRRLRWRCYHKHELLKAICGARHSHSLYSCAVFSSPLSPVHRWLLYRC